MLLQEKSIASQLQALGFDRLKMECIRNETDLKNGATDMIIRENVTLDIGLGAPPQIVFISIHFTVTDKLKPYLHSITTGHRSVSADSRQSPICPAYMKTYFARVERIPSRSEVIDHMKLKLRAAEIIKSMPVRQENASSKRARLR